MIMTYAEAISRAIKEEMLRDPYLTIIGEDIGKYGGVFKATKGLYEEFGKKRVKDTPVSETAIIGIAIGAALLGYRIIAEIMYVDFLTIASDQIVNQAAKIHYMSGGKLNVPIVIRTQGGAGIRNAAQHSQSLEAWFMHIPGLKVVMPSTPYDARGLLKASIRDDNPVIFIEHKKLYSTKEDVPDEEYIIEIGKADIKKEGKDITIICYSYMVIIAQQAAKVLAEEHNISCEIVDLRTISPLDKNTVTKSVKKTNKVLVLHEACEQGGIGGEIISIIQNEVFDYLDYPVLRICGPNTPVPYCPDLEENFIPNVNKIINQIMKHFKI
ncbi:MAG: alpha-ketoacid dehydrogenase subunit beta [Actinobacteria bacterium]|nr:alpha-ketoacid dehydrogenase subunit beta [Actinomycetota bacterium]